MDRTKEGRGAVNVNEKLHLQVHCPTAEKNKVLHEAHDSPQIVLSEWVFVPESTKDRTNKKLMADDSLDQENQTWLDALPVDKHLSGVGFSYNQLYKDDGYKHEFHMFEDKCFRFQVSEDCYLYGVFDGHCGTRAAEFVSQRLPAEIVLGQIQNATTDQEVQNVLDQAYNTVEKAYFVSLVNLIAERTALQQEIMSAKGTTLKPESVERLRVVDEQLSSGTSALVALIFHNKMYIANVGNSRALLCRTVNGKLVVEKLNDDHTLENEDEVLRLAKLGLPIERIRNSTKFGQQLYTRCIGDYSVKGGYKDNEQMSDAISEPVIAVPDIEDPVEIDNTWNFLLLMSDGVYRSLEDATNTEHVSAEIAGMVASEFTRQSTLNGVGQAVIDRIARKHHDAYALSNPSDIVHTRCSTRDDMTLLIRKFNYRLRSQSVDKNSGAAPPSLTSSSVASSADDATPTDGLPPSLVPSDESTNPFFAQLRGPAQSLLDTYMDSNPDSFADSIKSTTSLTLDLDADGRLEPYVSFEDYDNAVNAMAEDERKEFEKRLIPKMDCETIEEQPESLAEQAA